MKKKPLLVAAVSRTIWQANILKDGRMSTTRVDMTEDVLRATQEWCIKNDEYMIVHDYNNASAYLFQTTDEDKAKKIKAILEDK